MPIYEATMRVVRVATWTVEAKDEAAAREQISDLGEALEGVGDPGELVDWEVYELKAATS